MLPRARRSAAAGALLATLGLVLSACSSGTPAASSSSTTSTLPPLPPDVSAWVTLIGAGANLGNGDTVLPIDLTEGASGKAAPVRVGAFPAAIAIAPDGKTAYVTDAGTNPIGHAVTPINLATDKVGAPIPVGDGPEGIAVTPDGATVYVADTGAVITGQSGVIGSTVTPFSAATGKAGAPIKVGNAPESLAVSPDGSVVYVANANSESITPIGVATGAAAGSIAMPGPPQSIAFAKNGTTAWVTVALSALPKGGELVPIDTATGRAGTPIPLCKSPAGLAITPNGATAWVACTGSGELVPVNLATRSVGAPISIPGGPYALAVTLSPRRAPGRAAPAHHHRG